MSGSMGSERGSVIGDSPEAIMQRLDALRCLSLALADRGIVHEDGSLVDCAPILRSLEDQGYTLRLTTDEERFAINSRVSRVTPNNTGSGEVTG